VTTALALQATEYTDLYSQFVVQLDIDFKNSSLKSGSLGQELQTMFLAYSDSFLRQAQISKDQIEAKAVAVEEVSGGEERGCTVLYHAVLYCTMLYCTVLYCTVRLS
jgi:hypothetical protein